FDVRAGREANDGLDWLAQADVTGGPLIIAPEVVRTNPQDRRVVLDGPVIILFRLFLAAPPRGSLAAQPVGNTMPKEIDRRARRDIVRSLAIGSGRGFIAQLLPVFTPVQMKSPRGGQELLRSVQPGNALAGCFFQGCGLPG